MLLALPHLKDFADGALVHESAHALVFRRKTEFLGIHQFSLRRFTGRDHFVRFLQVQRERLFNDDVFSGFGRRQYGAMMEKIGKANVHHLAAGFGDGVFEVAEPVGDVMFFREGCRPLRLARKDRHHFRVRHKAMIGFDVDVRDESRAEQGNFGFAHRNVRLIYPQRDTAANPDFAERHRSHKSVFENGGK